MDGATGLPERCTLVGDAPIGSNMHSKRIKRIWGVFEGTDGYGKVSGAKSVPQRGAKSVCQRVVWGRENRGLLPIGEAPDSVRDLTRV